MSSYATSEVALPEELATAIHEHVHSDTENEVGGVLVGIIENGNLRINDVLPALQAVGGAAQLTFTHETWEHLLSTVDRDYPDQQIVGWYHSHPGHGIFLSTYDQFIHENFFAAPGMIALVVDPRSDDAFGWFGWEDGTLTRLGSDLPVDRPDRAAIPTEVSAAAARRTADEDTMDSVRRGVLISVAVLVIFGIGMWWGRGDLPEQLAAAQRDTRTLQANVRTMQQSLGVVCEALPISAPEESVAQESPTASESPTPDPTTTPTSSPTASQTKAPAPSPLASSPAAATDARAQAVCLQVFPQRLSPAPEPSPTPSPAATGEESTPPPSPATATETP